MEGLVIKLSVLVIKLSVKKGLTVVLGRGLVINLSVMLGMGLVESV